MNLQGIQRRISAVPKDHQSLTLATYGIRIHTPALDVIPWIRVDPISTTPKDLLLEADEVIIAPGLRCYPSGLKFKSPVKILVPHSAIITNPNRARIKFYISKTESSGFSPIDASKEGYPKCVVRKNDLDLFINHFSVWWIVMKIERFFIGTRILCTPFVPASVPVGLIHPVHLCLHDDLPGMREEIEKEFITCKRACASEQFLVKWRHGRVNVTFYENDRKIGSEKSLPEEAFQYLSKNTLTFFLDTTDGFRTQKVLKFFLKQLIDKEIGFVMNLEDPPKRLVKTPFPHDRKARDDDIEVIKPTNRLVATPFLLDRKARADDNEVIKPTKERNNNLVSAGDIDSHSIDAVSESGRDGSTVVMSTKKIGEELSPQDTPEGDPYSGQISLFDDKQNLPLCAIPPKESASSHGMELQSPLSTHTWSPLSHLPPGSSLTVMTGNIYVNPRQPKGDSNQTLAAQRTVVPHLLRHELSVKLNQESVLQDNWVGLATELGMDEYIESFKQSRNPTEDVIKTAEYQKKILALDDLVKVLHRMRRHDCVDILQKYESRSAVECQPHGVEHEGQEETRSNDSSNEMSVEDGA